MSVIESVSVDRGTLMSVGFDDRMQEIQNVATMSELDDTVGARRFRNPSYNYHCRQRATVDSKMYGYYHIFER